MTARELPPLADLLVTGTDTGVGKTYVTAALAAACSASGRRVAVLKAAQTGRRRRRGLDRRARAGDRRAHRPALRGPGRAGGRGQAGGCAGAEPGADRGRCARAARERRRHPRRGLRRTARPDQQRETFADLALALDLPLLIVARPGLGTLNHTALTVEVARARGIGVAGVVVCGTNADPDVAERTNLDELRRIAPLLGTLPYDPDGWPAMVSA